MYQTPGNVRFYDLTQAPQEQREADLAESVEELRHSVEDCMAVMLGIAAKLGARPCL